MSEPELGTGRPTLWGRGLSSADFHLKRRTDPLVRKGEQEGCWRTSALQDHNNPRRQDLPVGKGCALELPGVMPSLVRPSPPTSTMPHTMEPPTIHVCNKEHKTVVRCHAACSAAQPVGHASSRILLWWVLTDYGTSHHSTGSAKSYRSWLGTVLGLPCIWVVLIPWWH
jgi:hypothetical protein